jgi:type II secretory pathway component PulF
MSDVNTKHPGSGHGGWRRKAVPEGPGPVPGAAAPASAWKPSEKAIFDPTAFVPARMSTVIEDESSTGLPGATTVGSAQTGVPGAAPAKPGEVGKPVKGARPAKAEKQPRAKAAPKKKRKPVAVEIVRPVKLLHEPKPPKPPTKAQQAKLDRAQLIKEREADAAAVRINGTDEDIEIPKKPWLTVFSGKRARSDEIAETLTDLASMLENGQSEQLCVQALADQYSAYDIGEAYSRVIMLMDRGVTLGKAVADQTDNFPPVVRELIAAAKMPKDMHRNLRQAAIIIMEADSIKARIKSALFQPGFMFGFLILFTLVAIQFLLPMTAGMFTGIGADIPPMTVIILAIGQVFKWALLGLVALVALLMAYWTVFGKNNERIATMVDHYGLKAPLVGEIMKMSIAARFCDVLAACLDVGMSELESLETAGRACGNRALKTWVDDHVGRQNIGVVAFSDVSKTEMLPWNFRNRIETTTSVTRRIEILRELAESFHDKAQLRLNRFADRVGPITEAVVVVVVVIVVMLIVSPILTFIPTMLEVIG